MQIPCRSALLLLTFPVEADDAPALFTHAVRELSAVLKRDDIRPALSAGAAFLDGTAHGDALAGQPLFDALLFFPAFEPDQAEHASLLLRQLGDRIHRARSATIVGPARLIMPGSGDLLLAMPWRRPTTLTRADAQAYWHDHHGAVVRARGARTGYRQIHADAEASAALAHRLGTGIADHDGAVVNGAADLDTLRSIFSLAYVRDTALPDERRFIDHRRSTLQAFRPLDDG